MKFARSHSVMSRVSVSLLVLVPILFVVVRLYGALRWESGTRELRARLSAAREPVGPPTVDLREELAGLPAAVERYFRLVLRDGQPMLTGARVRHAGTFDMGEDVQRWRGFVSDQVVVARRPGFAWNGRVAMMPGLPVLVHDAYAAGEGVLHASLLGLFSVAETRGTGEVAKGELMRFFAEATWYPTTLLPSQGVGWEAAGDRSAYATLEDGEHAIRMFFAFDARGLIETVSAEARGRTVGDRIFPTPWRGRFWNYSERGGMLVPLDGEVAWLLPGGERPYWRGHITHIDYD